MKFTADEQDAALERVKLTAKPVRESLMERLHWLTILDEGSHMVSFNVTTEILRCARALAAFDGVE